MVSFMESAGPQKNTVDAYSRRKGTFAYVVCGVVCYCIFLFVYVYSQLFESEFKLCAWMK